MKTAKKPDPGDWVLLKGDQVIACGKDVKRLIRMFERLRSDDLVITKEPYTGSGYHAVWANQRPVHQPKRPRLFRLDSLGWTKRQIEEARSRLASFENDWNSPGMEKYDSY